MKKLLAVVMLFAMLGSILAGCTSVTSTPEPTAVPTKATYNLKLWGSQDDQAMLQTMVASFKAANADANYNIELAVVGEDVAKQRVLDDVAAAADVFSFSNDQIMDFVNAGALYEVTRNKAAITAANMAGSIDAATVNDKLYAYPSTADNGYFLYYDKSVFTADEANCKMK